MCKTSSHKLTFFFLSSFFFSSISNSNFCLQIPRNSQLHFGSNEKTGERLNYPCVQIKNVFVFPGSPHFLRSSFGSLCKVIQTTFYHTSTDHSFAFRKNSFNRKKKFFFSFFRNSLALNTVFKLWNYTWTLPRHSLRTPSLLCQKNFLL